MRTLQLLFELCFRRKKKLRYRTENLQGVNQYRHEISFPSSPIAIISIYNQSTTPLGYVIISSEDNSECLLWHIYVQPNNRGKGHGKALIKTLQRTYRKITTHVTPATINGEGTRLCLACGFKIQPRIVKSKPQELIWTR